MPTLIHNVCMKRQPLDTYDDMPIEMLAYLKNFGWHFNKKAYEYAVKQMRNKSGEKMTPVTKEEFTSKMSQYGISLDNDVLYDGVYVHCMAMSDFYKSSLESEQHIAKYVKDVIDDKDAPDGMVFAQWYAKSVRAGIPVDWEDLL